MLVMLFLGGQAYGFAVMDEGSIVAAQNYGKEMADNHLETFFRPWVAYDAHAGKADITGAKALVFTPYLLIAADSREKIRSGNPVTLKDAEKLLENYQGSLIFRVTRPNSAPNNSDKVSAVIQQGTKTIEASTVNTNADENYYLYFPKKEIAGDKSLLLKVYVGGQLAWQFNFDVLRIQ
jgi:hypothetical protein